MLPRLVLIALLCTGVHGTSNGAPDSVCQNANMFPSGHNSAAATGPSPYSITVDAEQYAAGASLTVTLVGSRSFKGFLILALPFDDDTGEPIGSFEVANPANSNLGQVQCGKGLTHTKDFSSSPSDKIVLKWNAPSAVAGNIIFYATFVESFSTFWVKLASAPIWDGVSPRPIVTEPSAPTDPPPIAAVSVTGCESTKSCYHDCSNDGKSCNFILTWVKNTGEDTVEIEMFGALAESENYLALGLSPKPEMMNVSIISCSADSRRRGFVEVFYAENRTVPGAVLDSTVLVNPSVSIQTASSPKTISCRFTYDNNAAKAHNKLKDLNDPMYAFIARGPYSGVLAQHTKLPKISPKKISFLASSKILLVGSYIQGLVKAHACLMILAWVFCASVGVILARYYKPMWEDTKACGQKVWFSYHRALMLSAMFLTIIGFVCILVYKDGLFQVNHLQLPRKAHPILGLIAFICSLLNPLIAAFRCGPKDSKRPIFNWIHWFFGTVAHVFAIVAIFLGMLFESVTLPSWITYVMMAFCLFHVCVEFILEIHQCCMYDKNRDRQELEKTDGKEVKYAGRGFKCAMLALYMIVVSIITVVLVVVVAVWGSVAGTFS